jgi:hypothetical protein
MAFDLASHYRSGDVREWESGRIEARIGLRMMPKTKYRNHRSNDDQRAHKTGYYGMTSSRNGPGVVHEKHGN